MRWFAAALMLTLCGCVILGSSEDRELKKIGKMIAQGKSDSQIEAKWRSWVRKNPDYNVDKALRKVKKAARDEAQDQVDDAKKDLEAAEREGASESKRRQYQEVWEQKKQMMAAVLKALADHMRRLMQIRKAALGGGE